MFNGSCPQCHSNIGEDRMFGGSIICSCGWTSSGKVARRLRAHESYVAGRIIMAFIVFVGLGFGFLHLQTLDGRKTFLSAKVSLSLHSQNDLKELSRVCEQTKDIRCAGDALQKLFAENPLNTDVLIDLSKLYNRHQYYSEAVETYRLYLKYKGDPEKVYYFYAKSLENSGQLDEAIEAYKQALTSKKGFININAIQSLVHLYMKKGEFSEAHSLVLMYRKQTKRMSDFEQEMSILKNKIRS